MGAAEREGAGSITAFSVRVENAYGDVLQEMGGGDGWRVTLRDNQRLGAEGGWGGYLRTGLPDLDRTGDGFFAGAHLTVGHHPEFTYVLDTREEAERFLRQRRGDGYFPENPMFGRKWVLENPQLPTSSSP